MMQTIERLKINNKQCCKSIQLESLTDDCIVIHLTPYTTKVGDHP